MKFGIEQVPVPVLLAYLVMLKALAESMAGKTENTDTIGMNMTNKQKTNPMEAELAEELRQKGNTCFGKGKLDEAAELYTKSLEHNPSAVTFANRAQVHIQQNKPEEAEHDAREALALDPANMKARFRLGRALHMQGALRNAIAELEKCRIRDPNNAQIRQEIENCKASSTASTVVPPQFAFDNLVIVGQQNSPYDGPQSTKMPLKIIELLTRDKQLMDFKNIKQLQKVLAGTKPDARIAIIILQEVHFDQIYQFFRSLNPKLLEGGVLQLNGFRVHDAQQFAQFTSLFRPISLRVSTHGEYPVPNLFTALSHLSAFRSAKHVIVRPTNVPAQIKPNHAKKFYSTLDMSDLVNWLHCSSDFSTPESGPSDPDPLPKRARFNDALAPHEKPQVLNAELDNLWRSPVQRMLQFHADSLVPQAQDAPNVNVEVEQFIGACNERFKSTSVPFNYTARILCRRASGVVHPRAFRNALGEHLRVSVQHLTMDNNVDPFGAIRVMNPTDYQAHDLVVIERFHRQQI